MAQCSRDRAGYLFCTHDSPRADVVAISLLTGLPFSVRKLVIIASVLSPFQREKLPSSVLSHQGPDTGETLYDHAVFSL